MGDSELYERRVTYLEDPAQLDAVLRAKSRDAFMTGKRHYCGQDATRISSPEAFATAFARALEHPEVQSALGTPGTRDIPPDPVRVAIAELLGQEGHTHCEGFRLTGDWPESQQVRKTYVNARAAGEDTTGLPTPTAQSLPSFADGSVEFRFRSNGTSYEISTMFVDTDEV